jgi:hypothetical protein
MLAGAFMVHRADRRGIEVVDRPRDVALMHVARRRLPLDREQVQLDALVAALADQQMVLVREGLPEQGRVACRLNGRQQEAVDLDRIGPAALADAEGVVSRRAVRDRARRTAFLGNRARQGLAKVAHAALLAASCKNCNCPHGTAWRRCRSRRIAEDGLTRVRARLHVSCSTVTPTEARRAQPLSVVAS